MISILFMVAFLGPPTTTTPRGQDAAWVRERSIPFEWSAPISGGAAASILTFAADQTVEVLDARSGVPLLRSPQPVGAGLRLVGTTSPAKSGESLAVCFDRTAVYAFLIQPSTARLHWRAGDAFDQPEGVRDDPEFLSRLVDAAITPAGIVIIRDDGAVGLLALADGALLRRATVPRAASYRAFAAGGAALVLSCGVTNRVTPFPLDARGGLNDAVTPTAQDGSSPDQTTESWRQRSAVDLPDGPALFADVVSGDFAFATRRDFALLPRNSAAIRRVARWRGLRAAAIALVAHNMIDGSAQPHADAYGTLVGAADDGAPQVRDESAPPPATLIFADEGAGLQGRAGGSGELLWFVSTLAEADMRRAAGDIRILAHADGLVVWGDDRELFCSQSLNGVIVASWRASADEVLIAACLRERRELIVVSRTSSQTRATSIPLALQIAAETPALPRRIRLPAESSAPRAEVTLDRAPRDARHVFVADDMLVIQNANTIAAYGIAP